MTTKDKNDRVESMVTFDSPRYSDVPAGRPAVEQIKRNFKDSVFRMVFSERSNALQFWKEHHPDSDATEDDIRYLSSESTFVNGIKSDIAFSVKDSTVILVEAQAKWSGNIAARCYFYVCALYQQYLSALGGFERLHETKAIPFPSNDIYVVYCGPESRTIPERVKFSDSFTDRNLLGNMVDCMALVLRSPDVEGVMKGYVDFCSKYRQNLAMGMSPREAARATIDWCIQNGIFPDFFRAHRMEVEDNMVSNETIIRANDQWYEEYYAPKIAEAEARGEARGIAKGEAKYKAKASALVKKLMAEGKTAEEIIRILLSEDSLAE